MALFGRARSTTGAGVITTLILVLVFGNQAFTEWTARHTDAESVLGWFLRVLGWPSWIISTDNSIRDLISVDLRALLLVVFVALVLSLVSSALAGGARFLVGWAALVFASALAALVTTFISTNATWLSAFNAASDGSRYGLFVGWIVGIGVASFKKGGGS
jgi:hypothetical protein